ncbi:MAG: hypothetical protein HDS64_07480 [Bacteroidales bacterium]|nr:hypothetical protein [Bacteroidales bacterium]MBD5360679.1 hypothetical protein [Bacteroides sp.]MBD5363007.1 hypothetical protein [Bacteroides sp.]MBD5364782.1 hypothetical protein [Bacteroides sp.]
MTQTTIIGKEISAPIWGGQQPAFLAPWSEIKKLGFKKRDRSFGHIIDDSGKDVPALFFMAAKNCCSLTDEQLNKCRFEWYVTTETLDEIAD